MTKLSTVKTTTSAMSKHNIVTLISLLALLVPLLVPPSSTIKRQTDTCDDSWTMNCPVTLNETGVPFHLYRFKTNRIVITFSSNCEFDSVLYLWTIYSDLSQKEFHHHDNSNVMVVHPFEWNRGIYAVSVSISLTRDGELIPSFYGCELEMVSLDPIPIILGGTYRVVGTTSPIIADGSKSIDRDAPPNDNRNLVHVWTCVIETGEGQLVEKCKAPFRGKVADIDTKYLISGNQYVFTLNLSSTTNPNWVTAVQTVRVLDGATVLDIVCVKNCPPAAAATDSKRVTFLRARCLSNCEDIEESSYEWTVNDTFDYEKSTQFGRNTDKFIVKENVFEYGRNYSISVKLTDRESMVTQTLQLPNPIKIEQCRVAPSEGTALSTRFKVSCTFTGTELSSEVFTMKDERSVILTKSPRLEFIEVLLPSDVDTYLKMTDTNDFQDVVKLDVKVNPSSEDLTALVGSVSLSASRADMDSVVQITNGIIGQIADKSPSETKSIKHALLQNLEDTKIKSRDEARQISSLVTALVYDEEAESDPDQGQMSTRICKEAARIELKDTRREVFPTSSAADTQKSAATLMTCAETHTKENPDALKPVPLDFNATTPFPVLDVPVIEEDYPDYDTDHSVVDKQKKYEHASRNFVQICKKSLEMLSLTVAEGEETVAAEGTNSTAQITKLTGKALAQKKIEIRGASLRPSRDFEKILDTVDAMVCSWAYNLFWWMATKRGIVTNILFVKFVKDGEEMKTFKRPNKVKLLLQDEPKLVTHEVALGNNSVVRIDVKKDHAFFIEFRNLSQTDSLRVLVTSFDKPEEHEVKTKGRIVTESDNVLYKDETNGFDSWYYLSVLPESDLNMSVYWVSIYTESCYSWSIKKREWTFACKGSSRSSEEQIECLCTHLSLLAGQIYNTLMKIDVVTTEPDFEMVLLTSWIILIASSTIFGLYCLLTIATLINKPKRTSIFLPGDIATSARYVYFVGIRTGKMKSSGTSSNICIKLFGTQNQSKGHVLNYPDPQKRIFQRGNIDWFIIPTSHRLGDLTQIALWSDYSGQNPRWLCSDVTVYDMQSRQKWYFSVKAWFNLPLKGSVYVEVPSSEEKRKRRFSVFLLRVWPKRSHQEGFSYFEKITFLLSIILTIFLLCMILYGAPSLTLKDGFARLEEYRFHWSMIWVGCVSSLGTFTYHMVLVWLLRNSGDGKRFSRRVGTLCWFILTFTVIVSMAVLVMVGFWVPTMSGFLWLTSVGVSVLTYFFILENCYEVCSIIYGEKKLIWEENLKKVIESIEGQRAYLFRKFGENLLRPYFKHLYRSLDEDDIKEKKLVTTKRKKLLRLLEDTVMFICYVTLLYLAILANRNTLSVENHHQMISLLSGEQTRTKGYESISSINDIYKYVNVTLIPTLHAHQWYAKYVVKDPGIMADFHNKMLGVARVRQRRIVHHKCPSSGLTNETCRSESAYSKESYQYFGLEHNDLDRLSKIWDYTGSKIAGISVYVGKFGIYSGGGFIAPLGRTRYNSYANLFYLKNNTWLDAATSVVMIEFLAYNVNSNLFSAVKIVLEMSATGYVRSKLDLGTYQFLFIKNEARHIQRVIFLSFVVAVAIFTVKFLSRCRKERLLMWKDLWTVVDLIIIALSYAGFVIFLHRADAVGDFLAKIEKAKKNEFIQYFNLLHEEESFTLVAALLVFVATIRLWKVCRFGTVFRMMEKTLVLAAGPIFLVLLLHMTLVMAFTLCGYLLFSRISSDFKDVRDTLITLMLLMLGLKEDFDFETLMESNPYLGHAYYVAYMLLNLFFMTVYVCVIMMHYYQAQVVSSEEFASIVQFFSRQFTFYKTSVKITLSRLKGGTYKSRRFVTPKSDELRYANSRTLGSSTLEMMACIAVYDVKKYGMTNKEKVELMNRVVRCCREGDDNDFFYAKKDEKNFIRIIHDDKMKMMAAAAELILDFGEKKRERRQKRYKKIMTQHLLKLDFIKQVLDTTLHVLSNIEIQQLENKSTT